MKFLIAIGVGGIIGYALGYANAICAEFLRGYGIGYHDGFRKAKSQRHDR